MATCLNRRKIQSKVQPTTLIVFWLVMSVKSVEETKQDAQKLKFYLAMQPKVEAETIVIIPKIQFGIPNPAVSKLPPVLELLLQRVQTYFSNYVHEDLSRPPTYDRPVYILPFDEERNVTSTEKPITSTLEEGDEEEEEEEETQTEYIQFGNSSAEGDFEETSTVVSPDYEEQVTGLTESETTTLVFNEDEETETL